MLWVSKTLNRCENANQYIQNTGSEVVPKTAIELEAEDTLNEFFFDVTIKTPSFSDDR